jgi:hypothetical protein
MTKEEAIEVLNDMKHAGLPKRRIHAHKENEALEIAIKALERKKGKWETCMEGNAYRHKCTNCGALFPFAYGYKYCPDCGARMEDGNGHI